MPPNSQKKTQCWRSVPGLGALTHLLAERAGRVVAVELDQRLIPILREQFADQPHVSFVHGDILELSPAALIQAQLPAETGAATAATAYKVVANLPYYITSAALRHILERADVRPTLAVVLVQREVAQRMTAQPGDMSLLAVGVQFYARPRALHSVPAGAFLPRPKVDSSVVRLDLHEQPAVPDVDPTQFFRIVRAGFGQRRKQLRNSLSAGLSCKKEDADLWLNAAGVDPSRRAQTLSISEWGRTDKASVRGKMKQEWSGTAPVGELLGANSASGAKAQRQWPASGASTCTTCVGHPVRASWASFILCWQ